MNVSNKGRLGLSTLAGISLSSLVLAGAGCERDASHKFYDPSCPDHGILDGASGISGFLPVDRFLASVVSFPGFASAASSDIQREVDALALALRLDPALLRTVGTVRELVAAKLEQDFQAVLTVRTQPVSCQVDAGLLAQANLSCQKGGDCDVTFDKPTAACDGECLVAPFAPGQCPAQSELVCRQRAPECTGQCSEPVVATGSTCPAGAASECRVKDNALCAGSCVGTLTPSASECAGSAACEGTTRADAGFLASCVSPAVEIDVVLGRVLDAPTQRRLDSVLDELHTRLPRLLAALEKARRVREAGDELSRTRIQILDSGLLSSESDRFSLFTQYALGACVPDELTDADALLAKGTSKLAASLCDGLGLSLGIGVEQASLTVQCLD